AIPSPVEADPDAAPIDTPDTAAETAVPPTQLEDEESFPYPAEYQYHADPTPHHSTPIIEQEVESFPYPAEYAYHAEGQQETTTTSSQEDVESYDDETPFVAGIQSATNPPSQPSQPIADQPVTAANHRLAG